MGWGNRDWKRRLTADRLLATIAVRANYCKHS